jgi:hypothetical protein
MMSPHDGGAPPAGLALNQEQALADLRALSGARRVTDQMFLAAVAYEQAHATRPQPRDLYAAALAGMYEPKVPE